MSTDTKATPAAVQSQDDEIAEIMNEIQNLQESIAQTEAPQAAPVAAPQASLAADIDSLVDELGEFRGSADEASMEETLAGMKSDSTDAAHDLLEQALSMDAHKKFEQDVASLLEAEMAADAARSMSKVESEAGFEAQEVKMTESNAPVSKADGCLTMTLTGNMTLKLKYEFAGQEVTLSFGEDALKVQLADGTEFKVPVGKARLRSVA